MSVTFNNTTKYQGRVNCFHVEPTLRDVMGYKLSGTSKDDIIPMGTPIYADGDAKTAAICKYAVVKSKTSTTKFILEDVGFLAVGDKIYKSGQASPTLSTISAIDTDTNEITLSAANSQMAAGDIVLEGVNADNTISPVRVPNRIVARTERIKTNDTTVSATYSCVAIQNVLNYPAEFLNTTTFPGSKLLIGCPTISFVKQ